MQTIKSISIISASKIENHAGNILQIIAAERSAVSSLLSDLSFINAQEDSSILDTLERENSAMAEARNINDFLKFAFHAYKMIELMLNRAITKLEQSSSVQVLWDCLQSRIRKRSKTHKERRWGDQKLSEREKIELLYIKILGETFDGKHQGYLVSQATLQLRHFHGHPDLRNLTERIDQEVKWRALNELLKELVDKQDYKRIHDNLQWVLKESYRL